MHNPVLLLSVEILSVVLNLAFLYFLIRQRRVCWIYGIWASVLSIFLMYANALFSEALLYLFYVVMGVYGYINWGEDAHHRLRIREWSPVTHLYALFLGILILLGMGTFFDRETEADYPYHDAFSTAFSLIATYMETRKILSGWIYWIILNLFTAWLYFKKDMLWYAGLMLIYGVFSLMGYLKWRKEWNMQK
ncbi:MAG: nicotinamide mononucleotide transporter [Flavobacteriales bacterium]|nr:nicotinamide mononucleotide transporter [Flavobacteriales bacterium]